MSTTCSGCLVWRVTNYRLIDWFRFPFYLLSVKPSVHNKQFIFAIFCHLIVHKTEMTEYLFYKLLQVMFVLCSSYLLLASIELSFRLISLGGESHFVVAAGYESFDWQVLDSSCWAECKKASVGDWRWSLDNIRWPLRAAETISLHGDTLLLLSCPDTFFPPLPLSSSFLSPSLFASLCLVSGVSASWQPVSDPEVIYW